LVRKVYLLNDNAAKLSALIIASISSFLTPFMISSVNIALPTIGKEFKTDAVLLSWVATSYLLAAAVSLVPFGKLADIYGRKKVFLSGQIIVTATSLLAAISVSAPMLIVFRIFQGAGVVLIAQQIVMAVFSPLAGRLSDRIEPRMIASLGMAMTTLGLILLALINHHTTLLSIVISLMVLGFGFALFSSPNMNAIMSSVAKRYYGIASGSVGTMRVLGQMLSMGIATLVFALFIGRSQITPDLYPALIKSIKIAFIIFSGLCAAGIFFSLSRGDLRSQ
jgi:MFS family permease